MTALGARIRQRRECIGMSQAELARRSKVHKNTMNLIETGGIPDPRVHKVHRIARALHTTVDALLRTTDEADESRRGPS